MTLEGVLSVDPDEGVRAAVALAVGALGRSAVGAASAAEALDLVRARRFAVAIVDLERLGTSGVSLLAALRESSSTTVRLVLTCGADPELAAAAINDCAVHRYLKKPLDDERLRAELRQALEQHSACAESERRQRLESGMNAALKHQNRSLDRRLRELGHEVQALSKALAASTGGAVAAIAALTEVHSSGIGQHGSRVAELCAHVGRRLGLDADGLRDLAVAARLHDVGKIGLSAQALHLPEDYLRPEELELVRAHGAVGAAVLLHVPGLEHAAAIVRHHHARYDGRGHPDLLAGAEIPLGARILAACDALDERAHPMDDSAPLGADEAYEAIREDAPARFDPDVLRALAAHLDASAAA